MSPARSQVVEAGRERPRDILPEKISYEEIDRAITGPVLACRVGRFWWLGIALALLLTILMIVAVTWLLIAGVGVWGIDRSVVWGFAIANYVWWLGIGHAGTFISALLLLMNERWRGSINRFAEAMTIFAVTTASLMPILHLGRPQYFYWLAPYPDLMDLWPQWRSPLVWDFFANLIYLVFSILFWYTGLIPDLATMRDRAERRGAQLFYGVLALGWTGSARDWARFESFYWAMAAIGVPLVISVHTIVGMDFAFSLMPGWQETIFPPYFVVGAMFSGFAMVVTLAIPIRWGFGLQALITLAHLEKMAKILLFGSLVLGLSYATEWFMAWYSGGHAERFLVRFRFTGEYAPWYWLMLACNLAVPQLFWWRAARRNVWLLLVASIVINVGMYLERILVIISTLSRGHLPSMWETYAPTFWDWALFIGTFGFFALLFMLLARIVPMLPTHEVKELAYEWGRE